MTMNARSEAGIAAMDVTQERVIMGTAEWGIRCQRAPSNRHIEAQRSAPAMPSMHAVYL
jgi:hypothetical protein